MRRNLRCAQGTSARATSRDSAAIHRTLEFITAPLVLEILVGLGHGRSVPDIVPSDAPAPDVRAAVDRLVRVGAAERQAAIGDAEHVVITPKGRWMIQVLTDW